MKNIVLLGLSKVDITPTYNVQTVGFNRKDNLSRGVLHKLYAEISLWVNRENKYCLITIDSIGFTKDEADIVRDLLSNKLNIKNENIMLCFSHTHSAPNISIEDEYFKYLQNQLLIGIEEAKKNLIPIKAAWGNSVADIGINRRSENGPLDKRIGVLKVTNTKTDKQELLVLRVTAHANVLKRDNYLISSDYIGVTRKLLEEKYGCMVMITQGASGNVKPKYNGDLEALDIMAEDISESISGVVDELQPETISNLSMFSETKTFYSDVPSKERALEIMDEAMEVNGIDGTNWFNEVMNLNKANIKRQSSDIEIQYFTLNNGCFCGVPNEIMCELALDVVSETGDDIVYFNAYTNGCEGYLASAIEYDKGGYEVLHSYLIYYIYSGIVMPFNRDTADELVKIVSSKWNEIKEG